MTFLKIKELFWLIIFNRIYEECLGTGQNDVGVLGQGEGGECGLLFFWQMTLYPSRRKSL